MFISLSYCIGASRLEDGNRNAATPARPIAPYKPFDIQIVASNFRNGGEIWNPDENANTSSLHLRLRGASIFSAAGFYDMFV